MLAAEAETGLLAAEAETGLLVAKTETDGRSCWGIFSAWAGSYDEDASRCRCRPVGAGHEDLAKELVGIEEFVGVE